MEKNLFQAQIERLRLTYGQNAYPEERIKMLWKSFNLKMDEEFKEVIDWLICNKRTAPMLAEFREGFEQVKKGEDRSYVYLKSQKSKTFCGPCGGDGLVYLIKKETGSRYAFRCNCENAGAQSSSIPPLPPFGSPEFS